MIALQPQGKVSFLRAFLSVARVVFPSRFFFWFLLFPADNPNLHDQADREWGTSGVETGNIRPLISWTRGVTNLNAKQRKKNSSTVNQEWGGRMSFYSFLFLTSRRLLLTASYLIITVENETQLHHRHLFMVHDARGSKTTLEETSTGKVVPFWEGDVNRIRPKGPEWGDRNIKKNT